MGAGLRKLPIISCSCDPRWPCFLFPSEAVQSNFQSRLDPERSPHPLAQAFILGPWVPGPQNPKGQDSREVQALQGCSLQPTAGPLGRYSSLSKRESHVQESVFLSAKVPRTEDQGLRTMKYFLSFVIPNVWFCFYLFFVLMSKKTFTIKGSKMLIFGSKATHSSILAWEIPRTEEPGGLQSMGSQRVRHD